MGSNTVLCDCGCILKKSSLRNHQKTVKHMRLLKEKEESVEILCSCKNIIPKNKFHEHLLSGEHQSDCLMIYTEERLKEKMSELFEERGKLSSSEYLEKSDRYAKIFKVIKKFDNVLIEVLQVAQNGIYKLHSDIHARMNVVVFHHWT